MRWRALVGAALVTSAAFGVVFAHRAAQNPPESRYLVVTSAVSAGEALESRHLGSVAIDLPEAVHAVTVERSDELLGRVAARSMEPSELLVESALLERERFDDPAETEVAVSVDPGRTPLGQFSVGDRVTVLSTAATGTRVLGGQARVTRIEGGEDDASIGGSASLRIGLALGDLDEATAVVDAAVNEDLTIVLNAPGAGGTP